MFNSFIKANNKHTLIWAICERRSSRRSACRGGFRDLRGYPLGFEPRITPPKALIYNTGTFLLDDVSVNPAGVPDAGSTRPLLSFALRGVAVLRRKLRC
jgi:hypothetical protein